MTNLPDFCLSGFFTLGAGFSAQEKSHIVQIIPQKKEANTSEQEKDY